MSRRFYDPNPAWPIPLWRKNSQVAYAHNDKELEQMTHPVGHPKAHAKFGGGWSTDPIRTKYPVLLYSKTKEPQPFGDPTVDDSINDATVAAALASGDWQREVILRPEKEQVSKEQAAKMEGQKVAALEAQIATLTALVSAMAGKRGPGRPSKDEDAA